MTYSVFVAEDEPRVREGIRNHLDASERFQLCGEAADGEMSLSAILELKPDVLIADIKMPFMDGLALSRAVKRAMPRTKILILSGHDEFDFAKQAISIGVDEYLLKPVSAGQLFEALDKIALRIETERDSLRSAGQDRVLERREALRLRDGFFDELLTGALDTSKALEQAERFGVALLAKLYLVAEMDLQYEQAVPEAARQLRDVLDQLLDGREDALWCLRGSDRVVIFIKGDSPEVLDPAVYEVVLLVRDELARVLGIRSNTFIGAAAERISGIEYSYREAHGLLRRFPNLPPGSVISHEDLQNDYMEYLTATRDEPVARRLRHVTGRDVEQLLDDVLGESGKEVGSSLYTYYRFSDLMLAAARIINETGGDANQVIPELAASDTLGRVADPVEIRALTRDILNRFIAYQSSASSGTKHGDSLARAKAYIHENYSDSGLSLNSVASYAGFSPSHFSTIFSQSTKETFIGFLTRVRMEEAKNLLETTDKSSSDIAFLTGYNDSNYFRYLFKKHFGMSPRDYRNIAKKEKNQ